MPAKLILSQLNHFGVYLNTLPIQEHVISSHLLVQILFPCYWGANLAMKNSPIEEYKPSYKT